MGQIQVRQAVLSDIEMIVSLFDDYRQFYGRDSNIEAARAFLLSRFHHGESVIFFASYTEEIVGFTQLYPTFSSLSLAPAFILNDLYVKPSARRLGVAKQLLASAGEHAKASGAVWLTLSTAVTNKSAQALYEKNGWRRDDEFLVYNLSLNA